MTTKTDTQSLPIDAETKDAALPAVVQPNGGDLVTRLHQIESEYDGIDDGDLSPEDSTIPVLTMYRKMDDESKMGIQLGSDPQARVRSVQFVWALKSSSRIHYPAPFNSKTQVRNDCRSADGKTPDKNVAEPKSPSCDTCPYAWERHWAKETPDGEQVCMKNMEALAYLADVDGSQGVRVARIRFSGTAVKPAMDYWNDFKNLIPKVPPAAVLTEMTLAPKPTDYGTFLVPSFRRASHLDKETIDLVIADRKTRIPQWLGEVSNELVDIEAADLADVPVDPDPFPDETAADPPNTVGESGTQYDLNGNPVEPDFDVDFDATAGHQPADVEPF